MPCTSLPYLSLTYQHLFFRTVILAYSHRADFDRAERADVDGDRGHLTASMDSPWHKPPMSRATRELNRPSSTSPSRPSARTRGAHPIVSGGPGRRGLAARVAGGSRGARPGDLAYILICSFAIDLISLRHALHVNISPRRRSFARDPAAPRSVSSVAEEIGR